VHRGLRCGSRSAHQTMSVLRDHARAPWPHSFRWWPGRRIVMGSVGAMLVFYSVTVVSYSLPFVGHALFVSHDHVQVALNTLALVAGSYACKPLAQAVTGVYADRHGRRSVLAGASAVAALSALLLAVLPSVSTIGVAAPIIFTALVALQVAAAGAEWPLLAAYIAESSPRERRGLLTSFASASVCAGWLLAIVVPLCLHAALSEHQYSQWGWRVAFLPAVALGLLSALVRRRLPDSTAFVEIRDRGELSNAPLREMFSRQPRTWLVMLLQVGMVSAAFFLTIAYPVVFVVQADKFTHVQALGVSAVALALMVAGIYPAGALADRFGPRLVSGAGYVLLAALTFPAYALMSDGRLGLAFIGAAIAGSALALPAGVYEAWLVSAFRTRYTGAALTCNGAAIALFGSPALLLAGHLTRHRDYLLPGAPLVIASLIGAIVSARLMSPTIHEPLG
jgi:MFS transporter, MHS family, proline/betaine transporter